MENQNQQQQQQQQEQQKKNQNEELNTEKDVKTRQHKRKQRVAANVIRHSGIEGEWPLLGATYLVLHAIIMFFAGFLIVFSTSVWQLALVLFFVSLDAIAIVFRHECPLTNLERKYLGVSACDMRNAWLKNQNIVYRCRHDYEKQIELLINVWSLIGAKMLCVLFLQQFQWRLQDAGGVYL